MDAFTTHTGTAAPLRRSNVATDQITRELVAMVREQIGPVAALRRVDVVAALPKTRSGKILRRTMRSIAAGSDRSAPSWIAPSSSHSRAISAGSPKPLIISCAPSAANAFAIARPIPDVYPVTSATLPSRIMASPLPWR